MSTLYIIMGVSGTGKTTIGRLLSEKLHIPFYDADDFHPQANIDKMSNGIPLDDADREPWLNALAQHMEQWQMESGAVLACSALKENYRKLLSSKTPVTWIYLSGSMELIWDRMQQRKGHYMKPDLLASQFETLEIPEYGIHVSISNSPEIILDIIFKEIGYKKA